MTCPHCGKEMKAEQVFCENCGKERLLVPVYEPEIEESVAETMSNIVDDIGLKQETEAEIEYKNKPVKQQESMEEIQQKDDRDYQEHHAVKQLHFLVISLLALVVFISVFSLTFYIYTENSYDYHYQKAIKAYNVKHWEEALYQTDFCLQDDPSNIDLLLIKLHIFQQQDNQEQILSLAQKIISVDSENDEANDIIIQDYINREEYRKVSKYLENYASDSLKQKYSDYLASFPEYSEEQGSYDSSITLKLFSAGSGDIYYTLDGSIPGKLTDRYTAPIKLVSGEYLVSSVYVNEFGVSSEVVTKIYNIKSGYDVVPEVSVPSGTYEIPQVISLIIPDDSYVVYYTTDGSDPNLDSSIYAAAFPMPLGESTFNFMMVDEQGHESEVVTYTYQCDPVSNYSVEQALSILKQNLISRQEMLDLNGLMPGTDELKVFSCNSVIAKDDHVYYLIYEYLQNTSGSKIKTGNAYAVSVTDASVHRAAITKDGFISISDF